MYEQHEIIHDTNPRKTIRMVMYLFPAAVLLLYVVIGLAQFAVRFVSPSLFAWGGEFLTAQHGLANTLTLILSCVPIAVARRITPQTNRWAMITALSATFLGGVVFLAVQSVEYENTFRQGLGWPTPITGAPATASADGATGELGSGNVRAGQDRWQATCQSCHGSAGEGVEGQGKDLRQSQFVQGLDDPSLLAFIKVGRPVADPLNTTGKPMPPKGGNPLLKDPQLMDIVAYVRSIQISNTIAPSEDAESDANADVPPADGDEDLGAQIETGPPVQVESADEFWIPRSSVPLAALGPTGLSPQALQSAPRPARANLFFAFFFLITGLHTVQVLLGLVILAWFIFHAVQIPYQSSRDLPVDLVARYWYFAVAIWIILFPMFYFI